MKSPKTGLFFGSFNPIHVGHLIIANFMASQTDLEQVWLVLSPHNPHKQKSSLANDYDRLHLIQLALEDDPLLQVSDIEFYLPKPSYTIDTLTYLKEKYPNRDFALIMGGDNLASFPKWKNSEVILSNHDIYVYQRPSYALGPLENHPAVKIVEAPLMQISSSYIRKCIKEKQSIRYLVPDAVREYIESSHMY